MRVSFTIAWLGTRTQPMNAFNWILQKNWFQKIHKKRFHYRNRTIPMPSDLYYQILLSSYIPTLRVEFRPPDLSLSLSSFFSLTECQVLSTRLNICALTSSWIFLKGSRRMLDGNCFVDLRVFFPFSFMRLSFSFGYIIGSDDDDDDDDCKRTSCFYLLNENDSMMVELGVQIYARVH